VKVYPGEGASNESVVVDNGKFQRFRWRFSYTLDMRPALSYGDMQSVAFPVTQPLLLANGGWPPGPPMPGSANVKGALDNCFRTKLRIIKK